MMLGRSVGAREKENMTTKKAAGKATKMREWVVVVTAS